MDVILKDFFLYETEKKINKKILFEKDYIPEISSFIDEVIRIPIEAYIDYICTRLPKTRIETSDVVQFSSLKKATDILCDVLKEKDNPGLKYKEIGKLLLDNTGDRKESAYIKYGENHAKLSATLGLTFVFYNNFYLSGIGYDYIGRKVEEKEMLMDRLIIRSTLISRMIQASQNGTINMREFLYMLSDSTYIRRRSNIKGLVDYLYKSKEYDFSSFVELLKF